MCRFRGGPWDSGSRQNGARVPGAGKNLAWQGTGYAWGRRCDSGRPWAWCGPGTKVALGHLKALTRGPR